MDIAAIIIIGVIGGICLTEAFVWIFYPDLIKKRNIWIERLNYLDRKEGGWDEICNTLHD